MFLGHRGADAENLPRALHHVNQVSREIPSKYSGNPVNATTIGPKYFGRNNGVGRINGIPDQITVICF